MHCAHFLRLDDFASGRDKFVVFRLEIQKLFSIVANVPQSTRVQLPCIVRFIARVSGHESSTCGVKLGVGVILVG